MIRPACLFFFTFFCFLSFFFFGDRRAGSEIAAVPTILNLLPSMTNTSFSDALCGLGLNILGVELTVTGNVGHFVIPDCFYVRSALWTYVSMTNVILNGTSSVLDPLQRLSALTTNLHLDNVRLLNPTTGNPGGNYSYQPNWTSLFSHLPALTQITLTNSSLVGSLPTTLPSLCTVFNVTHNALTGTIPNLLSNAGALLSGLTMDLSQNKLTGSVTSALLTPLKNTLAAQANVLLSGNQLTGTVASDLFSGLEAHAVLNSIVVDLSNNTLTGSIPVALLGPLNAITNLATVAVDLSTNKLTGSLPANLLNVTIPSGLLSFSCSNNSLSGVLPSPLIAAQVSNLLSVYVDLSLNQLSGSIPANLFSNFVKTGCLTKNLHFNCSRNHLIGSIPNYWPTFELATALSDLNIDLSVNGLTGSLPTSLCPVTSGTLSQLKTIVWGLYSNGLTGTIASNLVGTTNAAVTSISALLHNNSITGSLPTTLTTNGNLINLALTLADNDISGSLSSGLLSNLGTGLQYLTFDVSKNSIEGTVADTFLKPFTLDTSNPKVLLANLSNNALTGAIPTYLSNKVQDATVILDNNQFSGNFPSANIFATTSSDATQLTVSAVNNKLTGTLNVPNVGTPYPVTLNVSRNALTALSADLTSSQYLVSLDVSENPALTGSIPTTWFQSGSKLVNLGAGKTALNGVFPTVSGILNIPLSYLNLSYTPMTFCNGTSAWTSPNMTSCDLQQTSAHDCPGSYPSICNTRRNAATPSAASYIVASATLLAAAIASVAMFL